MVKSILKFLVSTDFNKFYLESLKASLHHKILSDKS